MTGGKNAKTVTQSDIAKNLGISVVSVSNALAGRKGVSDELRQRIWDAADELGYREKKEHMTKKKTALHIGVVISERYLTGMTSFYMNLYQQIVVAANDRKLFAPLEVLGLTEEENLTLPKLFEKEQADGILVIGELSAEYTRLLRKECRVPIVFVDHYMDLPDTDFIISDGYFGTCRLTRRLIANGYEKIAFVGTTEATSSIRDRYLGYRKAMMEHGLPMKKEWVLSDRKDQYESISVTLPGELPEAFVCNCDLTAGILIRELWKQGYRVPEDVAVVGFDNFSAEDLGELTLTTYDVDLPAMAKISINTLLRKMDYSYFTPRLRVVTGRIVEGNSFRKREGGG